MEQLILYIEQHWALFLFIGTAIVTLYVRLAKVERASQRHSVYDKAFAELNDSMFAVLDGLQQLGANGEVTKARERFLESRSKV
jgi:hypothetical protein